MDPGAIFHGSFSTYHVGQWGVCLQLAGAVPSQRTTKAVMRFDKLLAPFREFRDGLKWRWTKRSYDKRERIEDMHICMTHVESIEPKRWQKFILRLLAHLGDAPGGNPNRDPVTGARYTLPLEVRQAFTKVESPSPDVARVLEKIERHAGVAVDEVRLPEN